MPKGDSYAPASVSKDLAIQINAGGTSLDQNWEFPLIFDRNEWALGAVSWSIHAHQTYQPVILGQVNLDYNVAIISHNPDVASPAGGGNILWNFTNAANTVASDGVVNLEVKGSAPASVSIRVSHTYRLPVVAVSPQVCSINDLLAVAFTQLVDNPSSFPTWGTPTQSTTNTPQPLFGVDPVLLFAGISIVGIAGLLAAGYFADKTGLNVGVVERAYGEAKSLAGKAKSKASAVHQKAVAVKRAVTSPSK